MGEVYRGRDGRLDRDVAIKILPPAFAEDADRLARFEREAKMLASLNHANIAAIYGLEEAEGTRFIAMELVEGETLGDRIARKGPLELDEALGLARQIAEGLRAAHDNGVVHRDLKPANIQVTPERVVKVLDFGLAKAQEGAASASGSMPDQTQSPTMLQATGAGMLMGTAAYMSPEQAKGKVVDKRADIWAFGAVLYEMLTAEPLFAREDLSETLASVIRDDPELDRVPARVRRLVGACLQKDPLKRLRDIGDVWALLDDDSAAGAGPGAAAPSARTPWLIAGAAVVIALLAASVALPTWFRAPTSDSPRWFAVHWPTTASAAEDNTGGVFSVSPNGRDLVIVDNDRLWWRRADALEAREIDGTTGATYPFWSPDGNSVAFFQDGLLRKVSLATGSIREICEVEDGRGGSWGASGTILFGSAEDGVYRVDEMGGTPDRVTTVPVATGGRAGSAAHRYPQFLPGGETFLYMYLTGVETQGVYLGAFDGSAPILVLERDETARYAPGVADEMLGHLLFRRGTTLMAQPFDASTGELRAAAVPVGQGAGSAGNTGFLALSVVGGALAYSELPLPYRELVWVSRSGEVLATGGEPSTMTELDLSPGGKVAAVAVSTTNDGPTSEVRLYDLESGNFTPFTFESEAGWANPIWSPDGRRIAYTTFGLSGLPAYEIRVKDADMSGEDRQIDEVGYYAYLWDWAPESEAILVGHNYGVGDMVLRSLDPDEDDEVVLGGGGQYVQGQFSPDGRWLAYTSTVSGQVEVYVQPYPATGAVRQLSVGGGEMPRWRRDGHELFYVAPDGNLMAVPVRTSIDAGLQTGAVQVLFGSVRTSVSIRLTPQPASYAPADNGERFLVMRSVLATKAPITMVVDWQAGLQQ